MQTPTVDGVGVLKHIRASLLGASTCLSMAMELDGFSVLLKISLRPFIQAR